MPTHGMEELGAEPRDEGADWTGQRVVDYLVKYGARCDLSTGAPRIFFPEGTPVKVRTAIAPYLTAHKPAILEHFFSPDELREKYARADERERARMSLPQTGETPAQVRKRLISEAIVKGRQTGKPVWFLLRDGKSGKYNDPARKKFHRRLKRNFFFPVDREATAVSVTGSGWVNLPSVLSRDEEECFMSLEDRKKKSSR